ncbi:hypothetical protein GUJ93_ZPchr0009g785 [Zizania palustris]|uniref:Uncharacterized protein n=1 Tax=Zizania palustris TaxID=103762 RepID=A0A8J5VMN0_ZIZPA|nr:hypothetical protein GUJ93_ZPchr0009g785 [Zizania palustris]
MALVCDRRSATARVVFLGECLDPLQFPRQLSKLLGMDHGCLFSPSWFSGHELCACNGDSKGRQRDSD